MIEITKERRFKMPSIGDPAPDFTKHDFINDVTFTLSDHAGEVILLSFVWNG